MIVAVCFLYGIVTQLICAELRIILIFSISFAENQDRAFLWIKTVAPHTAMIIYQPQNSICIVLAGACGSHVISVS